jgi:hypothetical protein
LNCSSKLGRASDFDLISQRLKPPRLLARYGAAEAVPYKDSDHDSDHDSDRDFDHDSDQDSDRDFDRDSEASFLHRRFPPSGLVSSMDWLHIWLRLWFRLRLHLWLRL